MPELPVQALSGMPFEELAELILPEPGFRAVQVLKWIASGISSFGEMGNLPMSLRQELGQRYLLRPKAAVTRHCGKDGTVKLAVEFADGVCIEAVLLGDSSAGDAARHTACLSTQAGCPAGCVFCKTGSIGFVRNLSSAEIVEQFLLLRAEAAGPAQSLPVSNIVVMGMGEPLLNLSQLRKALAVISDSRGLNFSRRRITVSTC